MPVHQPTPCQSGPSTPDETLARRPLPFCCGLHEPGPSPLHIPKAPILVDPLLPPFPPAQSLLCDSANDQSLGAGSRLLQRISRLRRPASSAPNALRSQYRFLLTRQPLFMVSFPFSVLIP
ncbi:hypothetical protein N658DRAFT_125113 [Parathielavia hyrcaniae]|uniref:Uncharacterized protein n=1 Tax=Parathielavia hyrcaniae TaxID=113614 RepID=A0AAN6T623_9PEZI|nr:hypothetical protein N658DRAFT_125113 [Parathielavia hyrcaniae]